MAIETEYFKSEPKGGETIDTPGADSTKVQDIDVKDFAKEPEDVFTGKTTETFFVTTDYGIKSQDVIRFEDGYETLLGIQVPYFYYMGRKVENEEESEEEEEKKEKTDSSKMLILRNPMKDFVGLENVEENIKKLSKMLKKTN